MLVPLDGTAAAVENRLAEKKKLPPAVVIPVRRTISAPATEALATAVDPEESQSAAWALEPPVIRNVVTVSGATGVPPSVGCSEPNVLISFPLS